VAVAMLAGCGGEDLLGQACYFMEECGYTLDAPCDEMLANATDEQLDGIIEADCYHMIALVAIAIDYSRKQQAN